MPDGKSTQTVRWGIIGPGSIAHRFAGQLPRSRTGTLLAVGSRDLDRAKSFGEQFGAERWYGDYDELLADPDVDAVYVATPHPGHVQWSVRAAQAGKHVLCEKPIALNSGGAMAIFEAARTNGVASLEAYMYRYHPQTITLAELVASGTIGDLIAVEASFSFAAAPSPASRLYSPELGGGGILDVGGYPVSMARLLAAAGAGHPVEPVGLTASGSLTESGIDTWTVAVLRFPADVYARVTTGIGLAGDNVVTVLGSAGIISVPEPWIPNPDEPSTILIRRVGVEPEQRDIPAAAPYAAEADALAEQISRLPIAAEHDMPVPWADTLGTVAVQDAWRAAIGVSYPSEQPGAAVATADGRPLRVRPAGDTAMRYGRIPGIDKPLSRLVMGVDNQPNAEHAAYQFDDFVSRGGTTFDTAWLYGGGRYERQLGAWIRARGIREQVVVIGKGAHTPHCDPESITRQLYESLDRLGTDHVDLYLMHRDNDQVPVGEFVDVMDEHRRAGRIGAYGGSNWSIERFTAANDYATANGRSGLAALSNHFGLAEAYDVPWAGCRHVTDPRSRAWLAATGIPLLPWSSQARGFFAGRARPGDESDPELVRCYYSDANFERLRRAQALAARMNVPTTAVALAYVLAQPFPTFPLIGPRTLAETRTSFPGLSVELSEAALHWLDLSSDRDPG